MLDIYINIILIFYILHFLFISKKYHLTLSISIEHRKNKIFD